MNTRPDRCGQVGSPPLGFSYRARDHTLAVTPQTTVQKLIDTVKFFAARYRAKMEPSPGPTSQLPWEDRTFGLSYGGPSAVDGHGELQRLPHTFNSSRGARVRAGSLSAVAVVNKVC